MPGDGRNLSATLAGNQNIKPCAIWLPLQKPPDSDGSKSCQCKVMEGNLVHPCVWRLLSSRETNIGGARKWSSASQLAPLYSSSTTLVELSNPRCRCRRKGQKLPSSRHLPPVVCSGVAESLLSGETMAGVGRSCRFGRKQRKEASRLHTMGDHPLIPDPADSSCKVLQGFSKWKH